MTGVKPGPGADSRRFLPSGRAYSNGYMKFSAGTDRIDFLITEAHPRDFNNGVYHGYISDGVTYQADGTVVDPRTFSLMVFRQKPSPFYPAGDC